MIKKVFIITKKVTVRLFFILVPKPGKFSQDEIERLINDLRDGNVELDESNVDIICYYQMFKSKYESYQTRIKKPMIEKKGDWICISCRNMNFHYRKACNICFTSKLNNAKMFLKEKEGLDL